MFVGLNTYIQLIHIDVTYIYSQFPWFKTNLSSQITIWQFLLITSLILASEYPLESIQLPSHPLNLLQTNSPGEILHFPILQSYLWGLFHSNLNPGLLNPEISPTIFRPVTFHIRPWQHHIRDARNAAIIVPRRGRRGARVAARVAACEGVEVRRDAEVRLLWHV